MSFDRIFPTKMTLGNVHLQRCKQNALNHFCGNHCGKERPAELQRSHLPHKRAVASGIRVASKYLYYLIVTARTPIREWLDFANGNLLRGQSNLHRFGAFCSVRVTLIGICLSANCRFSGRDFRALAAVSPSIDYLQVRGYSDSDQRHWQQAEVLP